MGSVPERASPSLCGPPCLTALNPHTKLRVLEASSGASSKSFGLPLKPREPITF